MEYSFDALSFEDHLPLIWRKTLRELYFLSWDPDRILSIGLLPFGSELFIEAGPVCFDTRRRMADGDCPVVFWDHEWVGTSLEIQPLFSSCRKMFECLLFEASTDLNFFHPDEDDSALIIEQK